MFTTFILFDKYRLFMAVDPTWQPLELEVTCTLAAGYGAHVDNT